MSKRSAAASNLIDAADNPSIHQGSPAGTAARDQYGAADRDATQAGVTGEDTAAELIRRYS